MTAEEALAAAEAEGLPLVRSSESGTGFKYVMRDAGCRLNPFRLARYSPGHMFATAEVENSGKFKIKEEAREAKAAKAREKATETRARRQEEDKEARAREREAAKAIFEEHKRQLSGSRRRGRS